MPGKNWRHMGTARPYSSGHPWLRPLLLLAALLLLSVIPAHCQDGSTALEGLVEDLSGARIAGAAVTILNPDNGFQSNGKTDGEGRFRFAMLAPGRYSVTALAAGMATAAQSGL